jgi:hypothetical protein
MAVRTCLAIAVLLMSRTAAAAPAAPPEKVPLAVGGLVGYETDNVSGLTLRLDGELQFRELGSQLKLSWIGSVAYSHLTESVPPFSELKSDVIKAVPAARIALPLSPQFDVFGDVGLGLAYVTARLESHVPFFGDTNTSGHTANVMMRFGAGAWFHVNPQLRVGAMLEFDPIFGDYGFSGASSQNTFNILAGAMYRL